MIAGLADCTAGSVQIGGWHGIVRPQQLSFLLCLLGLCAALPVGLAVLQPLVVQTGN